MSRHTWVLTNRKKRCMFEEEYENNDAKEIAKMKYSCSLKIDSVPIFSFF
jgi:hypothetical protein